MSTTTSGIDWEEDGESDTAADQARNHSHLQEAQKQEGIQRVMVEHIGVGEAEEFFEPVGEAIGYGRSTLTIKGQRNPSKSSLPR